MRLCEVNRRMDKFMLLKRGALFALLGGTDIPLHFGQLPVLEYVLSHDGCTQVELADHFGMSPSSVAVSTKRMQRAGLLEKREDENNLRCKNLYVTSKGREAADKCRRIFDEFDKKVYNGISERDLAELCRIIDIMTSNIADTEDASRYEMLKEPLNN